MAHGSSVKLKELLSDVERTDLVDVTSEQMEQYLSDPATVQQLLDFLSMVQGKTTNVYSRSNAYRFSQELKELKDFDRLMAEMGYRCSFDPNHKYWTIIGKGWKRPKRLYKLGEDYTNERILERIKENSYAVKFSKFAEPQRQVSVYRLKREP